MDEDVPGSLTDTETVGGQSDVEGPVEQSWSEPEPVQEAWSDVDGPSTPRSASLSGKLPLPCVLACPQWDVAPAVHLVAKLDLLHATNPAILHMQTCQIVFSSLLCRLCPALWVCAATTQATCRTSSMPILHQHVLRRRSFRSRPTLVCWPARTCSEMERATLQHRPTFEEELPQIDRVQFNPKQLRRWLLDFSLRTAC